MGALALRHLRGRPVVLLECGSLNPIHLEHVEMLICARRYLQGDCGCSSVEAIISPVGDSYEKVGWSVLTPLNQPTPGRVSPR